MIRKNGGNQDIWVARIVCVILACCLWLYVMSEQNPIIERDFVVPLGQRNLTEGMLVFNMPERVSVRVRGPRTVLAGLTSSGISAYVNLTKLSVGTHTVLVTAAFDRGEIVEVSPRTVSLFMDVSREKIVPVTGRIIGKPVTDVAVTKQVLTPSEVKIRGASTRLDAVDKVVAPVDVSGRSEDFTASVNGLVVGKDGLDMQDITVEPEQINVRTSLIHQVKTAELPVKASFSGTLPASLKLTGSVTNPFKVTVSGPPSLVDGLKEVKLEPVDLSQMVRSTTVRAKAVLPEGVQSNTQLVDVQITVGPAEAPKAD